MSITMTVFGRLTKDPENKTSQNGNNFVNFSVAVNHGKNAQGTDEATFIEVSAFGRTGENVMKYCRKGARICVVVGQARLEKWTSQNGAAQGATLRGTAQQVDIVDWSENNQTGVQPSTSYAQPPAAGYQAPAAAAPYPAAPAPAQPPYSAAPGQYQQSYNAAPPQYPSQPSGYAAQPAQASQQGRQPW